MYKCEYTCVVAYYDLLEPFGIASRIFEDCGHGKDKKRSNQCSSKNCERVVDLGSAFGAFFYIIRFASYVKIR